MIRRCLKEMLADDGGAVLVEYAIILALLSLAGVAALAATATNASNTLNAQQAGFDAVQTSP